MNAAITQQSLSKLGGRCLSPKFIEKSRTTPRKGSISKEAIQFLTPSSGRGFPLTIIVVGNDQEKQQPLHFSKVQEKVSDFTPNIEIEKKVKGKKQVSEIRENGGKDGQAHLSKPLKQCFNQYCWKLKEQANFNSPSFQEKKRTKEDHLSIVKLENSNEKILLCKICMESYINKQFCQFCNQVYFDHINIDDQGWIQCDKCDLWNHLQCESEKMQDESKYANAKYQCPRCRKNTHNSSQMNDDEQLNMKKTARKNKRQVKIQEKIVKTYEIIQETRNNSFVSPSKKAPLLVKGSRRKESFDATLKASENEILNQLEIEFAYSITNFKKNKKISFVPKKCQASYQYNYPLHIPGYQTLEDLIKSQGVSISLDDQNVRFDLQMMKNAMISNSNTFGENNTQQKFK